MLSSLFAVSVYGGYFAGGYGVLLMAHLSLFGARNLNVANGLKNVASAGLTIIAVAAYAAAGEIRWPDGLLMMGSAAVGGYVGARLVRRVPDQVLRSAVIVVGLAITSAFFWREYAI